MSTLPDLGAIFDEHVANPISRTVSPERVIDEFIFHFTHDSEVPWMLPGIAPTAAACASRWSW